MLALRVQEQSDSSLFDVTEIEVFGLAEKRPGKCKRQKRQAHLPATRARVGGPNDCAACSRGGVAERNIKELKGTSPLGARRIKWNTIGAATAAKPST